MKKTTFYCDRCGKELAGEGARIIPHYFDFEDEGLAGIIDMPDNLMHFCLDCTTAIMGELIRDGHPPEKESGKGKAKDPPGG